MNTQEIPSVTQRKKAPVKVLAIVGCLLVAVIIAVALLSSGGGASGSGDLVGGGNIGSNVQCLNCDGTGYYKDAKCSGFGTRFSGSNSRGESQYVKCPDCGGTGKIKCSYCNGTGWR